MKHLRIILLSICLPVWAFATDTATVLRVVDGDTLVVQVDGRQERVRLIGVDTPETVHPNKPVEYFGKEASAFTKRMAEGKSVRLEGDPDNSDKDHYGRLLRYVWLPNGKLLNLLIVQEGYGHAYTRFPFTRMEEFRQAEREARELGRGQYQEGHSEWWFPVPPGLPHTHNRGRDCPSFVVAELIWTLHYRLIIVFQFNSSLIDLVSFPYSR